MNVALIIFNRADHAKEVFEKIRQAKPERLFVIADGQRPTVPADIQAVAATRAAVESVDWPCQVYTNYAQLNMGCGRRVASGLDWVFQHVEDAVILEDDCLPGPSFFLFCQTLLDRYRHDPRIVHIAGTNLLPRPLYPSDAIVSRLVPIWGWATWRRAWQRFDYGMSGLKSYLETDDGKYFGEHASFVRGVFTYAASGRADNWDAQWAFSCVKAGGLSMIPRLNLVQNTGFGTDATHTTGTPVFRMPRVEELPAQFRFPTSLSPDRTFDRRYMARLRGLRSRPVELLMRLMRGLRLRGSHWIRGAALRRDGG